MGEGADRSLDISRLNVMFSLPLAPLSARAAQACQPQNGQLFPSLSGTREGWGWGDTFFFPVKFNERLAIGLGRGRAIKREWGTGKSKRAMSVPVCSTKTEPFGLPVAGCARCMIYKLVINFQPLACRGYCAVCAPNPSIKLPSAGPDRSVTIAGANRWRDSDPD